LGKTVVKGNELPKPAGPYSPAIRAGDFLFCAGQIGRDPATSKLAGESVEEQTRQALTNLSNVLKAANASMQDVVKTTVFMADLSEFSRMNAEYAKFFPEDPPARSTVGVSLQPGLKVEIELVAYVGK